MKTSGLLFLSFMLGDVNSMYICTRALIYVHIVYIYIYTCVYRQCFHIRILPIEHDIVNTYVFIHVSFTIIIQKSEKDQYCIL